MTKEDTTLSPIDTLGEDVKHIPVGCVRVNPECRKCGEAMEVEGRLKSVTSDIWETHADMVCPCGAQYKILVWIARTWN